MKASEYRAQLRAAYEAGRQVIDMETCVELCVLGDLLPEVREKAKWQIEYEFAMNWFQRSGNGLDARFVRALGLELDDARRFVAANGKLPPWAVEMAERRYFVEAEGRTAEELKGSEVEKLKSPEPFNPSTFQPFNSPEGAEGEILRSEGGVALRTGKAAPKGAERIATGLQRVYGAVPPRVTRDE